MKKVFAVFCLSLCSVSFYGIEEDSETRPTENNSSEEVALLHPNLLSDQPSIQEGFGLPSFVPDRKSSFLAVSLSTLFPGLGHVYLEDYRTAGGLLGSSGLFTYLDSSKVLKENFREANGLTFQSTWFYGIYAAYRDVRIHNRQENYSYKMPTDSFTDLLSAPFQWSIIKKPEVWGGVLGALTLGLGMGYFLLSEEPQCQCAIAPRFPLLAFPVGIGEEAFFRGFLQSTLSEMTTPIGGIALSSLAFGGAHLANAELLEKSSEKDQFYKFSIPFITSFGIYFGWLAYKNVSLKESVAVHVWYDFILFLLTYAAPKPQQSASINRPSFVISIPF